MSNFLLISLVFMFVINCEEVCNDIECEPGDSGKRICQNYGYCSSLAKQCCLGRFGNCTTTGSRPIRPQRNCFNDYDCGAAYCDRSLKICCTEGDLSESYCPGKSTLLSVEPSCRKNETCPVNSTCIKGSCCPSHEIKGSKVIPLYFPYTTNRKCWDYETPPLLNMFCRRDTQRWAILGEYRVNGTENLSTDIFCRTNEDCSSTTVCVQISAAVGICHADPMNAPPPDESSDPYWLTLYISLPTACLLFGCLILIYMKKRDNYWQMKDQ